MSVNPTPQSPAPRRHLARLIKGAVAVALLMVSGGLAYFMFEPLLGWNIGWKNLPPDTFTVAGERKIYLPAYSQQIAQAQVLLERAQRDLNAPAMSVAVGVDGELAWAEARGLADIDARTPARLDSRFRIGSTSKAMTATAMGKLIEAGKLDIDAPIHRYAAYFPAQQFPVTTRQVLSHTAGFRDYSWCFCFPVWEFQNTRQYNSVQESLAPLASGKLEAEPGTRFKYTSPGFNVAGAVAEGASGKPFPDFLTETLFVPLEMRNTSPDYGDREVPGRVRFYHTKGGSYRQAFAVNNSNKWPAGGIVSTPSDLVRMGNALVTGRYLRADVSQQLFTPQKLKDGADNPQRYALGWRNHQRKLFGGAQTATAIHHGGTAAGSTSFLVLFPDQKIVVSILMNLDSQGAVKLHQTAYAIAEIFLAERVGAVKPDSTGSSAR